MIALRWVRSWWRLAFNPEPLANQVWRVEGVGIVTVHETRDYTVVCTRSNGEPWAASISLLRTYGALCQPRTLDEVQELGLDEVGPPIAAKAPAPVAAAPPLPPDPWVVSANHAAEALAEATARALKTKGRMLDLELKVEWLKKQRANLEAELDAISATRRMDEAPLWRPRSGLTRSARYLSQHQGAYGMPTPVKGEYTMHSLADLGRRKQIWRHGVAK